MDKQSKKIKKTSRKNSKTSNRDEEGQESRMIIRFQDSEGVAVQGSEIELSTLSSINTLTEILKQLLDCQNESQQYSFFYNQMQIRQSLGEFINKVKQFSSEQILPITYHPQCLFHIRPITRWSSSLQGHSQPILSVQFDNSCKYIASGSGDTNVRIWDQRTETCQYVLQGHKQWVLVVQFNHEGSMIASGGMDGLVMVWDMKDGSRLSNLKGHTKWVTSLVWSPIHNQNQYLCSAGKDLTIRVWNVSNATSHKVLSGHKSCITKLLWGGDNRLYSGSEDKTIKAWNPDTGEMIADMVGHSHWVNSVSLNTDYIIRSAGKTPLDMYKSQSNQQLQHMSQNTFNKFIKEQKQRLVSCSDDYTLILWSVPQYSQQNMNQQFMNYKQIKRMTGHSQPVNMVSFSPDGKFIVSASFDKSLKMWDGFNGSLIGNCRGHVQSVYQIAWSADSRMFVSGSKDSTLKVWDVSTKKLMFDLPGHSDEIYAVDWSVDGQKVVSGGKDKLLKIWKN